MSTLDDFSKKMGSTFRTFGGRVKEIADMTKLSNRIGVKRTELEQLYISIGKRYVQIHDLEQLANPELDALCSNVQKLLQEIGALQCQVDDIRKVRRCPVCGEESPLSQRFCGSCGARFTEATGEDSPVENTVQSDPPQDPSAQEPCIDADAPCEEPSPEPVEESDNPTP